MLPPKELESLELFNHEEYLDYILDSIGFAGTHVGYYERDNFKSHIYQFSHADGKDYYLYISPNTNGEVQHILSFAQDSIIEKRQGYKGITVIGGLDLQAYQRADGDYSDLPSYPSKAYEYYYKDLKRLISGDILLNSNYLQADIIDRNGSTVLTVSVTPYLHDDQENYMTERDSCSNDEFYFDQTCIN